MRVIIWLAVLLVGAADDSVPLVDIPLLELQQSSINLNSGNGPAKFDASKNLVVAPRDNAPKLTKKEVKMWLDNPDADIPSPMTGPAPMDDNKHAMKLKGMDNPIVQMKKMKIFENFLKKYGDKRVYLVASNGKFLGLCKDCGGSQYEFSATLNGKRGSPRAMWTIRRWKNWIGFQASNGLFLTRINGAWDASSYPEAVMVASPTFKDAPAANWKPEPVGVNTWAFRGDLDYYMTWAPNSVAGGSAEEFVFQLNDKPEPASTWSILIAEKSIKGGGGDKLKKMMSKLNMPVLKMDSSQALREKEKAQQRKKEKEIQMKLREVINKPVASGTLAGGQRHMDKMVLPLKMAPIRGLGFQKNKSRAN